MAAQTRLNQSSLEARIASLWRSSAASPIACICALSSATVQDNSRSILAVQTSGAKASESTDCSGAPRCSLEKDLSCVIADLISLLLKIITALSMRLYRRKGNDTRHNRERGKQNESNSYNQRRQRKTKGA